MDTLTVPSRVRRPAATLWLLRIGLTAHLIAVLLQPVLAGMFLTGDVDAITVHASTATTLTLVGFGCAVVAVGYVIGGRGRVWILPALLGLVALEVVQIVIGYTRALQWHVPLGVAIVVASVLVAIWVWTPAATRPRGAR